MERDSGFPTETGIIGVHWRVATYREIMALCSVDGFSKPPHWGSAEHPWMLLVPKDPDAKFGWALSRTSDPNIPDGFHEIRLEHAKHLHTPKCRIITKTGVLQFAPEEVFKVHIASFIKLQFLNKRCELELPSVILKVTRKLKK